MPLSRNSGSLAIYVHHIAHLISQVSRVMFKVTYRSCLDTYLTIWQASRTAARRQKIAGKWAKFQVHVHFRGEGRGKNSWTEEDRGLTRCPPAIYGNGAGPTWACAAPPRGRRTAQKVLIAAWPVTMAPKNWGSEPNPNKRNVDTGSPDAMEIKRKSFL